MSEIRVEGSHVTSGYGHLYLVYIDDSGEQFVIRGGPTTDNPLDWGPILLEINQSMYGGNGVFEGFSVDPTESEDTRPFTPEALAQFGSTVLDLGGLSPETAWDILVDAANNLQSLEIPYSMWGPNSNTVIDVLLDAINIDVDNFLPTSDGVSEFNGREQGDLEAMNLDATPYQHVAKYESFIGQAQTLHAELQAALELDALEYIDETYLELSMFAFDFYEGPGYEKMQIMGTFENQFVNLAYDISNYYITHLSSLGGMSDEFQSLAMAADTSATWVEYGADGALPSDPLVLDLDGDGIEMVSFEESTADFNFLSERPIVAHGWLKGDDGFLAVDANGNGLIDDVSELFGDSAVSGFQELANMDLDQDGMISSGDTGFQDLLIWRDQNEDGISQGEELYSLDYFGIASLSLSVHQTQELVGGNVVTSFGEFSRADGTAGILADVVLFGAVGMDFFEINEHKVAESANSGRWDRMVVNGPAEHSLASGEAGFSDGDWGHRWLPHQWAQGDELFIC